MIKNAFWRLISGDASGDAFGRDASRVPALWFATLLFVVGAVSPSSERYAFAQTGATEVAGEVAGEVAREALDAATAPTNESHELGESDELSGSDRLSGVDRTEKLEPIEVLDAAKASVEQADEPTRLDQLTETANSEKLEPTKVLTTTDLATDSATDLATDSATDSPAATLAEPTLAEPTLAEPTLAEPTLAEPTLAEPTLAEPTLAEPTLAEPTLAEPTLAEPTLAEPTLAATPAAKIDGSKQPDEQAEAKLSEKIKATEALVTQELVEPELVLPELAPPAPTTLALNSDYDIENEEKNIEIFVAAVDLLLNRRYAEAEKLGATSDSQLVKDLIVWTIARLGGVVKDYEFVETVRKRRESWPLRRSLARLYEASFLATGPRYSATLDKLASRTIYSSTAQLAVLAALKSAKDISALKKLANDMLDENGMTASEQKNLIALAGKYLDKDKIIRRLENVLYRSDTTSATQLARLLDKKYQAYTKARVAVIKRSGDAVGLLDRVPKEVKGWAGYRYALIQRRRRANEYLRAKQAFVESANMPANQRFSRLWVEEARIIARTLLDRKDYKNAYEIYASFSPTSKIRKVEVAFQAGWIAFSFLDDYEAAAKHFKTIVDVSSGQTSLSRGHYWLGRSQQKLRNHAAAKEHFVEAARYPLRYYGMLACAELKTDCSLQNLVEVELPETSEADAERVGVQELIVAARLLSHAKQPSLAAYFLRKSLDAGSSLRHKTIHAEIAALLRVDNVQLGIGARGVLDKSPGFLTFSYPRPEYVAVAKTFDVDRDLVHSIIRQESAFNGDAFSSASAMGLMQLIAPTAKDVSRNLGIKYERDRLRSDLPYNVMLGSKYLSEVLKTFRGSYPLAVASYNAGPSRIKEWVRRYGSPSSEGADVVHWVERIPFPETRNYVQRVLENFQIYRQITKGAQDGYVNTLLADLRSGDRDQFGPGILPR